MAPRLAVHGAFSPDERYTKEDIADLVEFARLHGVRLVPEIDTPAHAGSWCDGHPEICPAPDCREPLRYARNCRPLPRSLLTIAGLFLGLC